MYTRCFRRDDDNDSLMLKYSKIQVLEPPAEYLEEDLTSDDRVPPDALYMLHSIRVFGHFEKPVFLMLCKHTEILNLPAGGFLFKVG